jgi:HK97 family phage prohead protease
MEYKAVQFKADSVDAEKRIVSGYASTYDLDQGGDIITRGAFAKTLETQGNRVKVLWQHNSQMPIGRPISMAEDDRGLYVESYIAKTRQGDEALELAKEGIIDSMSIGYMVNESEYKDDGVRVIKELTLMEYSLVTWPMNQGAVITGVKSVDVRDVEKTLRDAGFSRSQAKAIAGAGVKSLREADQKQATKAEFIKALQESLDAFTQNARN